MIRMPSLLHFEATTKNAELKAKRAFFAYCVITGLSPEYRPAERRYALDAAHILPRSTFPELAKCVENILPIIHYRHNYRGGYPKEDTTGCLDLADSTNLASDRNPIARIRWLVEHVHPEFWPQVQERLTLLMTDGAKISRGVLSRREEALEIIEGRE